MSFTFDGVNCETLGMFVSEYPDRPIPQRKATAYNVAGRNGDLIVDEDAYENVIQEYSVFAKETANTLHLNLSYIAKWLVGKAGYLKLVDTYDPTVYRMARVANGFDFLNALNRFGKATIQFDCQPQRFPITDEIWTETIPAYDEPPYTPVVRTYPATGFFDAYPLVEINGKNANQVISIDIGSLHVDINTPAAINKIVIDTETQSIYNAFNGQRPYYTTVSGTWERLGDGDTISAYALFGANISMKITSRRYGI